MANAWIDYALQREDAEIVALVDIKKEFAEAKADKYGLKCRIFTDLTEAITATGANLVFDVTIPESHFGVAATAMQSGCDVFSEKPLAATIEECMEIVRVSDRTGRSHSIMQNRRFDPRIRALQKLIATETIGQAGYASADFFLAPHFGGFRDAMESPLLLDMAIHTFDQARLILGADPVSVYCQEFNPPGSWYAGNASAVCIFEMSNGAVFSYQGSWCAEGAPTSWEASWRITGEKGTAIWDGHGAPYADVVAVDSQEGFMRNHVRVETEVAKSSRNHHVGCLDEMFAAIAEGRKAETNSRDNFQSMLMVFGALESAKTGQKIVIEPWLNRFTNSV